MITLTQIAAFRDTDTLEKARHGRYTDTAENRRLHRVGQEYGKAGQEDPEADKKPKGQEEQQPEQTKKERNGDSVKRELELLEDHKEAIVEKYGEKAYNKKVESLKKEGEDFEQKETVKELKERADKEDAEKAAKEAEDKSKDTSKEGGEDKALQEAIKSYKEKQDYLKNEVQAIKDMAKKLKRKVDSEELEDIMYDFEVWMDDYGSELKYDIEKEVKKDGLSAEDVQFAIDELEEYALSYYEQDVKGIKKELEELSKKFKNSKRKSPKTAEDFRKLGSKMTDKQFHEYLELPGVKERYEEAKIKLEESKEDAIKKSKIYQKAEEEVAHFVGNKTGWGFIPYYMDSDSNGDYFYFKIRGRVDGWSLEIDGKVYLNGGNVELEPADSKFRNSEQLGIIQGKIDIILENKKEFDKLILDTALKRDDDRIAYKKFNHLTYEYDDMYNGYGGVREVSN